MADQEIDQCDSSIFENKGGLAEDLKFLACMPELCDVTFLVGEAKEPVCAVKAILAARSRVFHKMFYSNQLFSSKKRPVSTGSTGDKSPKKFFSKRSSEPLLNNPKTEHASGQITITVEEFEPDVFRQFIEYIHTGCVTLQARTLLGLMNAADYYGLDELRRACSGFVHCCINVDTVCALLASAEKYIQYKSTKSLVQKALEFVDLHGDEVLTLASFTLLPQHVVRLVLSRDELRADELTKFHASLLWSQKYREKNTTVSLREAMEPFLEYIKFHRIPAARIMKDVHPTDSVPDHIIMNALAYQADPNSVDLSKLESPRRSRISRTSTLSLSGLRLRDSTGSTSTLNSSSSSDVPDNGRPSTDGGTSPIIYKREEVS